jgi:hypothetical protein
MGITIHYLLISKSKKQVEKALNIAKFLAKKLGYEYIEYEEEGYVDFSWFGSPVSAYNSYKNPKMEWRKVNRRSLKYLKELYGVEPLKVDNKISTNELDKPRGVYYYTKDFAYSFDLNAKNIKLVYVDHFVYARLDFNRKDYYETPPNAYPSIQKGIKINTETTETFDIGFFEFKKYYICDNFCKTQPFTNEEVIPNIKHHINFCSILETIEPLMDYVRIYDEGEYYKTHDINKLIMNFGLLKDTIWNLALNLTEKLNITGTIGGKYTISKNDQSS